MSLHQVIGYWCIWINTRIFVVGDTIYASNMGQNQNKSIETVDKTLNAPQYTTEEDTY